MANFYMKKIENCMDCDHHTVERIWTPDSWEHVEGCYCTKCNNKLVGSDDWDVRDNATIPDWCPMLEKNKTLMRNIERLNAEKETSK